MFHCSNFLFVCNFIIKSSRNFNCDIFCIRWCFRCMKYFWIRFWFRCWFKCFFRDVFRCLIKCGSHSVSGVISGVGISSFIGIILLLKTLRTFSLAPRNNPTIIVIIFWNFFMFHQISLSSQLKQVAIISYNHGIYELPHHFSKNLRLRILGN